ncbi:MAG: isoprenylcysteine carboxylmethyltransferase family protein [Saprospiraceae bacterium]|nr:isoprenylcysteine carboxylmethyltransferase family protein [Saprospiraceae bacterium]
MVKNGNGTPLPIDQTTKLVLTGPYRYVRNPMAIAGVGQGIAVSIIYASIPIFIYSLIGAILWQLVVRPIEENNLKKRFGKEYEDYKQKISCWIPKLRKIT